MSKALSIDLMANQISAGGYSWNFDNRKQRKTRRIKKKII